MANKAKTHKGLLKRVRVTGKGKIKFKHPNAGHLMSGKPGSRKRHLRKPGIASKAIAKKMQKLLHTDLIGYEQD